MTELALTAASIALTIHLLSQWRSNIRRRELPTVLEAESSSSVRRNFLLLKRVISTRDERYVRAQAGPGLAKRMRSERRSVAFYFLRRVRADVRPIWADARAIAKHTEDPNFAYDLTKQYLIFQALCSVVWLQCLVGVNLRLNLTPIREFFASLEVVLGKPLASVSRL